jgi:enoyl-CoA hydratase/carnithine racemase
MNALSQPLALALAGGAGEAWYDRVSRVVVVRGAGGNFSAGGDLKGMKQRVDCYRQGVEPPNDAKRNLRTLNRITAMVRKCQAVIAWMEGSVAGRRAESGYGL